MPKKDENENKMRFRVENSQFCVNWKLFDLIFKSALIWNISDVLINNRKFREFLISFFVCRENFWVIHHWRKSLGWFEVFLEASVEKFVRLAWRENFESRWSSKESENRDASAVLSNFYDFQIEIHAICVNVMQILNFTLIQEKNKQVIKNKCTTSFPPNSFEFFFKIFFKNFFMKFLQHLHTKNFINFSRCHSCPCTPHCLVIESESRAIVN